MAEPSDELEVLRERVRRLEVFVRHVAHDLKTPMRKIRQYAELAGAGATEDRAIALGAVQRIAVEGGELIDGLLDWALARNFAGSADEYRLDELIRELADDYARTGTFSLKLVPVVLSGDALHVRQLLRNLFENAVAYRHPDRPLIVDVELVVGLSCVLSVRDNGLGFTGEASLGTAGVDPERIFDPGYRGASSQGHGLGLAIVREIADFYGWRVRASNRDVGGAEFVVEIG